MKFIKKNLKWITISFVMIIIIGCISYKYFLIKQNNQKDANNNLILEERKEQEVQEEKEIEPQKVSVDIKGAVALPGVYEIEITKKVIDVVQLAGGFTEQADSSFVNLAKKVEDEMVIIIYTTEEVKKWTTQDSIAKIVDKQCICPVIKNDACINEQTSNLKEEQSNSSSSNSLEKINLNTATLEELQTLSGIGESKAQAIITYREEVGAFEKIEDLMKVSGIGEALYEKVKDYITV